MIRGGAVVGEAVFAGITDVPEASWGAAVQASDFEQLGAGSETGSGTVVGLADGVDRDAFMQRLEREFGEFDGSGSAPEAPIELARLREIEALPWILTGFLGLVGLVAVVNAVVTTTRRRAHHLAVLRLAPIIAAASGDAQLIRFAAMSASSSPTIWKTWRLSASSRIVIVAPKCTSSRGWPAEFTISARSICAR